MKSTATILLATAILLPSAIACSDDPLNRPNATTDNSIQFSMSVLNTSKIYARSTGNKYSNIDVKRLNNAQFPYLFCGTEDNFYNNPVTTDNTRGYIVGNESAYDDDGNATQKAVYDNGNYTKISTCSFLYDGNDFFNEDTDRELYISDLDLSTKSDGNGGIAVTADRTHYWPDNNKPMEFFAAYPSPSQYQPSKNDKDDRYYWSYDNIPSITTTVESNMVNQLDYLFAYSNVEGHGTVSFKMSHIMTAVQVQLGSGYQDKIRNGKLYIVSVTFDNIGIRGEYKAKEGGGSWTVLDNQDKTCFADFNDPNDSNNQKHLTMSSTSEQSQYFFMLPQKLTDNSSITIIVYDKDEGKEKAITSKIKDATTTAAEWQPGKLVSYIVNTTEENITYTIFPAPTSQQSGVEFNTDGSVTTATKNIAADLNGDKVLDINDNYVMYFSYDGTPAGNGDTYSGTVYDVDSNGNKIKNDDGSYKTKAVSIRDAGCLNVYSVKTISAQGKDDVTTGCKFTIEVDDDATTGVYKSCDDAIPVPDGDYNPLSCNYCTKLYLEPQTGVNEGGGDAEKLAANAAKFTFCNTTGVSTNERTAETADRFLKYVCLSVYRPDIDSNNQWKRWKDADNKDTQYSSNCYIINYPGFYKIPVVYGPAIQNNGNYTDGAVWGTSGTSALGTAVKFSGNTVNSSGYTGWINWQTSGYWEYSYPGNNANKGAQNKVDTYILWQDVQGEVVVDPYTEKITPGADEYYINFRVGVDENGNLTTFKPCNAVIYVTNTNNETLWSYHIWVTPYSYSDHFDADTNPLNAKYSTWTWLDVPIGYEQEDKIVYAERSTRVKLVQEETGAVADQRLYLIQERHEKQPVSCVYYQWGRKDPFPGGKITEESSHLRVDGTYAYGSTDKIVYGNDGSQIIGNSITMTNTGAAITETATNPPYKRQLGDYGPYGNWTYRTDLTVSWGIKNPNTFVYGYVFPTNDSYWDLWGCIANDIADTADFIYPSNNNGTDSRKTIYDPSPIGYKVPSIYLFPAITSDGKNHSSTYSPLIYGVQTESEIYSSYANTAFKSHKEFSEHAAFDFYTSRMTPESTPKTDKGVEPKGKKNPTSTTFRIYAFGQINNSDGRISDVGTIGRYWSSTRWSNFSGASGAALVQQRMDYFEASCNDGSSTFGPATANTNSYGFPILPARDPTNSPNL
jgi:hypothetical protein